MVGFAMEGHNFYRVLKSIPILDQKSQIYPAFSLGQVGRYMYEQGLLGVFLGSKQYFLNQMHGCMDVWMDPSLGEEKKLEILVCSYMDSQERVSYPDAITIYYFPSIACLEVKFDKHTQ